MLPDQRDLLIDCGWYAALKMQHNGYDARDVETLFFTHCHHDLYMGLPALLFYRGMWARRSPGRAPLTLVGPPDDLPVVTRLARDFLQGDRFPEVWPSVDLHPLEAGGEPAGQTYTAWKRSGHCTPSPASAAGSRTRGAAW